MNKEKIIFENSQGQKLVGDLYNPEFKNNAIAIFCHGYRSTKESSKVLPMADKLASENISLLAFDLADNGESEPKFEESTLTQYIADLRSAIDYAFQFTKKIGVIGNSLGGIVSLQEVAKDPRVKVLVEQSPVSIFPWKKKDEFSDERVKEWKEKGYTLTHSSRLGDLRINYSFYEDATQYTDYNVYKNIKIPVFIIHGTEDKSVSIEDSKKLIQYLENSKLISLEGADHRYTNPDDFNRVIEETCKFIAEVLK